MPTQKIRFQVKGIATKQDPEVNLKTVFCCLCKKDSNKELNKRNNIYRKSYSWTIKIERWPALVPKVLTWFFSLSEPIDMLCLLHFSHPFPRPDIVQDVALSRSLDGVWTYVWIGVKFSQSKFTGSLPILSWKCFVGSVLIIFLIWSCNWLFD